ncbi:hypothetical protein L3X38_016997 [Prunus dulcis]|uniref:Uncharacterized protein n=1 Tax=Prunus dulcis TaxID=3755 RepID=A0AAD4W8V9_PRUDU|nr:hypothetical protein L3X38_016997 [Prunus dulcis]
MGVDDFFNPHGDADFDPEPDPESGSSFDDPDPDPDPDYDDEDPNLDSEYDPDPHSDDDPNPEFVSDSDPDPDFDSDSSPDSGSDSEPIPTQPVSYASSAAQIMTSRLTTPTHGPDCAYCGDPRHTCETCFKSHGYPNWWATLTDRGQCNMTSNGTGYGFHTSDKIDSRSWIIDSGATDHMTFDPDDFLNTTQPRRTCIANANGVTYPVTGAGIDIHTKEILGRGFKDSDFTCDTCILAKSHRVPYPLSTNKVGFSLSVPVLRQLFDARGKSPKERSQSVPRPARGDPLSPLPPTATGSGLRPPCPALIANPFPEAPADVSGLPNVAVNHHVPVQEF